MEGHKKHAQEKSANGSWAPWPHVIVVVGVRVWGLGKGLGLRIENLGCTGFRVLTMLQQSRGHPD